MKFLSLEKDIFGLDISDRSLKLINLKKKKNSFGLASYNEIDIDEGVIEGGVIKNEEALVKIIGALMKGVKGKKVKTKYVAASLPEEKSFLQVIKMPKMTDEELASAIVFEAENYIPLPIGEVYLDFQTIKPIKDNLNHLDVLIVATPKKIVNSYVACLKKAGLIPYIFEIESQAIARALIKGEISSSPVVLVDFGRTSTIFIVFAGRSIQFTCSIPVSSDQLTTAISKSLEIDLDKAEKVKEKYDVGSKKVDQRSQKIQEAVNPVLQDLAAEIRKYLDFYQDHSSHEHLSQSSGIQKILLCGGGANLKGLPEFLTNSLEVPVELGNFWANFPPKKDSRKVRENYLPFITALGLALRGNKAH